MTESTETTTAPESYGAPRPPLRRSSDRVLAGVAGGIGRWLGIDPVIVRVVLVVLAIFGGSGLLLYVVGWLFIPEEGSGASQADRLIARGKQPGSTTRTVLIVIGVAIGVIVTVNLLTSGPFDTAWGIGGGGSLLLILTVIALMVWLVNRDQPRQVPPDVPPAVEQQNLAIVAEDSTTSEPRTGYAYGGYGTYPGYSAPTMAPAAPLPPRARSYLGLATMSVALITMGVLGTLSLSGLVNIPVVVVLSAGLGVLGLGLLIGSAFGRARWLLALGIPLLLVTALVAVIPANLHLPRSASVGDRAWSPTTAVAAAAPHSLTVGSAVLDLTELAAGGAVKIPVKANVGIGELIVVVPPGMRVELIATAGLGEVRIDGLPTRSGQDVIVSTELPGVVSPTAPTIVLDAQVGIGSLEVSRA